MQVEIGTETSKVECGELKKPESREKKAIASLGASPDSGCTKLPDDRVPSHAVVKSDAAGRKYEQEDQNSADGSCVLPPTPVLLSPAAMDADCENLETVLHAPTRSRSGQL